MCYLREARFGALHEVVIMLVLRLFNFRAFHILDSQIRDVSARIMEKDQGRPKVTKRFNAFLSHLLVKCILKWDYCRLFVVARYSLHNVGELPLIMRC